MTARDCIELVNELGPGIERLGGRFERRLALLWLHRVQGLAHDLSAWRSTACGRQKRACGDAAAMQRVTCDRMHDSHGELHTQLRCEVRAQARHRSRPR